MSQPEDDAGITPVSELFTYHIFGTPPQLEQWKAEIGTYSLKIMGLVESELDLTVQRIQSDFAPVSGDMVLQCMTNVHWGRIHFTGARLLDVLEHADLRDGADKVAIRGADGFDTDLRIDEIRESPDAFLLAYALADKRQAELVMKGIGYCTARVDDAETIATMDDADPTKAWLQLQHECQLKTENFRGPQNLRGLELNTITKNTLDQLWLGQEELTPDFMKRFTATCQEILDKPM